MYSVQKAYFVMLCHALAAIEVEGYNDILFNIFSADSQIVMYNCLMNSICVGYDLKMARKPPRQEVSRCAVAFSTGEGMWKVGP